MDEPKNGLNPDNGTATDDKKEKSNVQNNDAPDSKNPTDGNDAPSNPNDLDDDDIDENNLPVEPDELKKLIKKLRHENGKRRVLNKDYETKLSEFEIREQKRLDELKQKELDELTKSEKFKELAEIHSTENSELKTQIKELQKELKTYRQKDAEIQKEIEEKSIERTGRVGRQVTHECIKIKPARAQLLRPITHSFNSGNFRGSISNGRNIEESNSQENNSSQQQKWCVML